MMAPVLHHIFTRNVFYHLGPRRRVAPDGEGVGTVHWLEDPLAQRVQALHPERRLLRPRVAQKLRPHLGPIVPGESQE